MAARLEGLLKSLGLQTLPDQVHGLSSIYAVACLEVTKVYQQHGLFTEMSAREKMLFLYMGSAWDAIFLRVCQVCKLEVPQVLWRLRSDDKVPSDSLLQQRLTQWALGDEHAGLMGLRPRKHVKN